MCTLAAKHKLYPCNFISCRTDMALVFYTSNVWLYWVGCSALPLCRVASLLGCQLRAAAVCGWLYLQYPRHVPVCAAVCTGRRSDHPPPPVGRLFQLATVPGDHGQLSSPPAITNGHSLGPAVGPAAGAEPRAKVALPEEDISLGSSEDRGQGSDASSCSDGGEVTYHDRAGEIPGRGGLYLLISRGRRHGAAAAHGTGWVGFFSVERIMQIRGIVGIELIRLKIMVGEFLEIHWK